MDFLSKLLQVLKLNRSSNSNFISKRTGMHQIRKQRCWSVCELETELQGRRVGN